MKRAAILVTATACLAAAPNDHAIIERAFAKGRAAELESDLYNGKAALYRPIRTSIRITAVRGERCESRVNGATVLLTLDWREVTRLELAETGDRARLYIRGGLKAEKLIVDFESKDEATPVLLAMERLQTACRAPDQ